MGTRISRRSPWTAHPKGEVPAGHYTVPIGKAEIIRSGVRRDDRHVRYHRARRAGGRRGAPASMPRSSICARIVPLDVETLATSVSKTGRCVIAHEATQFSGLRRGTGRDRAARVLLASRGARSSASPAGTRRIRTPSNGSIFRAASGLRPRWSRLWRVHEYSQLQNAGSG